MYMCLVLIPYLSHLIKDFFTLDCAMGGELICEMCMQVEAVFICKVTALGRLKSGELGYVQLWIALWVENLFIRCACRLRLYSATRLQRWAG